MSWAESARYCGKGGPLLQRKLKQEQKEGKYNWAQSSQGSRMRRKERRADLQEQWWANRWKEAEEQALLEAEVLRAEIREELQETRKQAMDLDSGNPEL